jgi:hypothetical protein
MIHNTSASRLDKQIYVCIAVTVKLVEILVKKFRSKLSEVSLDEEVCTCRGREKINTSRHWVILMFV